MSITIIKAGICDTIQDAGRNGYAVFGINPSGVMDVLAMKTANALAGNSLTTAVIEMHFPAPVIQCNHPAILALSGADFDAVIQTAEGNKISFKNNKAAYLPAGSSLSFNKKIAGERCFLAVHGGFNLPQWFGSSSTNLKIKEGGYKGRRLLNHDILPTIQKHGLEKKLTATVFQWFAYTQGWYDDPYTYNFLPGPEWDWLDTTSKKYFLKNQFTIEAHSDRMGITLQGLSLQTNNNDQLLSSGVNYGTIQLLPNGQMIVLAADHPTTGGYPRIANIITAHLPKLAQAAPGSKIKFLKTSIAHAEDLLLQQHKELLRLERAVRFKMDELF